MLWSDVYFQKASLGYCVGDEPCRESAKSQSGETTAARGTWQKFSREIKVPGSKVVATK